jgi:hypothetical protein
VTCGRPFAMATGRIIRCSGDPGRRGGPCHRLGTLVLAWLIVVLFDAFGAGASIGISRGAMTWLTLFGPTGPVEWVHGMGFVLIEDAGGVRHVVNRSVGRWRASTPTMPHLRHPTGGFVIDAPYLTVMAAIPSMASYVRAAVCGPRCHARARTWSGGSAFTGSSVRPRRWAAGIPRRGVRRPVPVPWRPAQQVAVRDALEYSDPFSRSRFSYELVDRLVEESIELLAVTAMLGLLVVLARHIAGRRASTEADSALPHPLESRALRQAWGRRFMTRRRSRPLTALNPHGAGFAGLTNHEVGCGQGAAVPSGRHRR